MQSRPAMKPAVDCLLDLNRDFFHSLYRGLSTTNFVIV